MLINNDYVFRSQIYARAYIYFDYNEPIQTNPAITKILEITNTKNINNSKIQATIYPNPTFGELYIKLTENKVIKKINILNIFGKNILELDKIKLITEDLIHCNLEGLVPGTNFLRIQYTDEFPSVSKVILH